MQDSMQLPESQVQVQNHNQYTIQQVISPKGRRLTKGYNFNTESQQSLAYSNSTYNKNNFTQRSPPFFNLEGLNSQNINTLNFRPFDRKQSTYGSNQGGLAIQFDKIKEQSLMENSNQDKSYSSQPSQKQRIQLPYFLSNENSPNNAIFTRQNDSLDLQGDQVVYENQSKALVNKKFIKVNSTSKKDLTQKSINYSKKQAQKKLGKQNKTHTKSKQSLKSQSITQQSKSPLTTRTKSSFQSKNPDEILYLKQKIKQLQYALQVQSISTQQLRAKVCVLNQLLEAKFLQKNGINFRLFKNSAPQAFNRSKSSLSLNKRKNKNQSQNDGKNNNHLLNIDLYVQMKVMQKANQQIQIECERLRSQLFQKSTQLEKHMKKCDQLTKRLALSQKSKQEAKMHTFYHTNESASCPISNTLAGQTNSQGSYQKNQNIEVFTVKIQQLKQEINQKDLKIQKTQQKLKNSLTQLDQNKYYTQLLEQKEKRFSQIERPKFISQIKQLTQNLEKQKQQIQKLQMENNLHYMQQNKQLSGQSPINASPQRKKRDIQREENNTRSVLNQSKISANKSQIRNDSNMKQGSSMINKNDQISHLNQVPDAMALIMIQQEQLKLLKTERDYFRQQYQLCKSLQGQNYSLRLKNQDLQNQLSSLHQLIEVEDEITF